MSLLHRWLLTLASILAGVILSGPCHAQGSGTSSGTSIGAFVGEPSGISLHVTGAAGAYVLNIGWSTRRDEGADLSMTGLFYDGGSRQWDRVFTYWGLTGGPRFTFFDNTEYSVIAPASVSFVFPDARGRHEIHVDAGPSLALSPHMTTSLYAIIGYRFYK